MGNMIHFEQGIMRGKLQRMITRTLFLMALCLLKSPSSAWHVHYTMNRPFQTRVNMINSCIQRSEVSWKRSESESHLRMTAVESESLAADEKDEAIDKKDIHTLETSKINGEKNEPLSSDKNIDGETSNSGMLEDTVTNLNQTFIKDEPTNGAVKQTNTSDTFSPDYQVCRVVALPDGKLPTVRSELPPQILKPPYLLDKLDALYHAMSYEETRRLQYLERSKNTEPSLQHQDEDSNLISVLRNSLEDAGFELLTRRDTDLCEALNAGYLLRLSIAPDVSDFDPIIAADFYPENFDDEGNPKQELLFEGRVLLYRRGYSAEVSEGRLLLPKLDYLQASIVQRSARHVTQAIGRVERQVVSTITAVTRHVQIVVRSKLAKIADNVPSAALARFLRVKWGWKEVDQETLARDKEKMESVSSFKLPRYGGANQNRFLGSPGIDDALDPFLSCDAKYIDSINGDFPIQLNGEFNTTEFPCQYDSQDSSCRPSASQDEVLIERVSINNVVDLSTRQGRRTLVKRFFAKSKLVEPTFEEVVAIWRPLPKKPKRKLLPPKFVYSIAEIFEVEDKLPEFEEPPPDPLPLPLEIRSYDSVPMANVPAVLPKTKLLFRPADAFVFDFITVLSFAAVIGSQRFDNPRLDLLAIVSGTVWIIRTIVRYSNKLARYDLLVKKFLTSKISYRNSGALKYITREAGNQRAIRAALVFFWINEKVQRTGMPIPRRVLIEKGSPGVNELFQANESCQCVRVDIDAALNDLSDLDLISFSSDGEKLVFVRDEDTLVGTLKRTWDKVFEEDLSLNRLVGQRSREPISE